MSWVVAGGSAVAVVVAVSAVGSLSVDLRLPFLHAEYLEKLTGLRDRLKTALSGIPAEGDSSPGELAEQIKALKDLYAVETAPVRINAQKPRLELVCERVEPHARKPEDENPGTQGEDEANAISFRSQVTPRSGQLRLL